MDLQAVEHLVRSLDPWEIGKGLGGVAALGFLLKGTRTLARIEAHMAAHSQHDNERFGEVEKKFDGVDRRADGMRGAIHEIGEKITGLSDAIVGKVQEIVARIEMKVEDQGKRIDDVLVKKGRTR